MGRRRRGRPSLLSEEQYEVLRKAADEIVMETGRWVMFDEFTPEEARSIRRRLTKEGYEVSVVKHRGVLIRRKR